MAAHPNKFTAALSGEGRFRNKAYFFVDSHYIRYDMMKDKVSPNYPKQIKQGWHGLPNTFHSGIQAAVNGSSRFAGKAYMFKGSRYVRYDWARDRMDSGYPKRIAGNWHGLPADFTSNFDAALVGSGQFKGKAYFFKGMRYIRYNWARDRMDANYPRNVIEYWHDIFEGYGYKSGSEVERIVRRALRSKLKSNFKIFLGDAIYYCPPLDDVQAILRSNTIDQRRWISEKHDCDDFAFLLKAAFIDDQYRDGSRRVPYCVGIIWGDKLSGGPHAMNWMINSDSRFRLIEPQTDEIRSPRRSDSGIYFMVC